MLKNRFISFVNEAIEFSMAFQYFLAIDTVKKSETLYRNPIDKREATPVEI